ncbi:MAG: hypothetical protein QM729_21360 [Solirubrobacterales bacterium]
MTATGEAVFSTTEERVSSGPAPLTAGEYGLRLSNDASIAQKKVPGSVPYINVSFEVLESATTEGGKNRRIFTRFFLNRKAGRDGVVGTNRKGGIVDFAQGLGAEFQAPIVRQQTRDENGNDVTLEYLDPEAVKSWLTEAAGQEVRALLKIQAASGDFEARNEIKSFKRPSNN